jgi:hypothetical protein
VLPIVWVCITVILVVLWCFLCGWYGSLLLPGAQFIGELVFDFQNYIFFSFSIFFILNRLTSSSLKIYCVDNNTKIASLTSMEDLRHEVAMER